MFGIDALAGAGRACWETRRADPLGVGVLATGLDGRSWLASIGLSAPWQADGATFKPFVRVLWQRIERAGGNEGAASAARALGELSTSGTRATAGLSGNTRSGAWGRTPYTMQYNVGVGRDNGTLSRTAQDTSLVGIAATVVALHAGRSFVQAGATGSMFLGANAASYFGVATGLHGSRADASVSGAVRYAF